MAELEVDTPRPTKLTLVALRVFGQTARSRLSRHPDLPKKLAQAREPMAPVAYLAAVYMHVSMACLASAMPLLAYLAALPFLDGVNYQVLIPLAVLPVLIGGMVYSWDLLKPDLQIKSRRQNIEDNLPYALNFMAALAAAGVVPVDVFASLGSQSAYGEVAKESSWIYRDTRVFKRDLVDAMRLGAKRTPSRQFEEFLQGAVNTITSGGDFKAYLLGKAEQFSQENHRKQKAFLESMGVMAESYVVVAAAAPLFLIVILSVMTLISSGGDPVLFLNILAVIALPVIHGAFTWLLRNMRAD